MNRHGIVLTSLIAIAITGCSQQQPTPPAKPGTSAPASVAKNEATPPQPPAASSATSVGYTWLPKGIALGFPYHLRSDRIYKDGKGNPRRRVALEFLEGNAVGAIESVEKSMAGAKFKSSPHEVRSNGKTVLSFRKNGYGVIKVTVADGAGSNPSNPDAKGTLIFNFPAHI